MVAHNALSNSELHEDKDVSTADDYSLYFSDGAGSGAWAPAIRTVGSWTHSTDVSEVEFTGLGDYPILQLDLVGIELDSSTARHILVQVGNDGGYTTSSLYYNNYWSSGQEDTELLTGMVSMFRRTNSPANSSINYASMMIGNFNMERWGIATSQEAANSAAGTTQALVNRTHFIKEQKIYNKLRVKPSADNLSGGSIIVTGWRYDI